jgi:predicted TPR repeat methyltransferase
MSKLSINEIFKLAIKYHKNKSFRKAKNFYQKTLEINPHHLDAYNNLGIVLKELGDINESIVCFNKVIKINPRNLFGYYNLGIAYKEKLDHKKAISCFSQVVKINPNHYSALNNLGIVFKEIGELKKAKKCYENVLKIKSDHLNAYYNLGNVLFDLRKFEEAESVYKKALNLKPNDKYLSHMIASLRGKKTNTAPKEYVENVFNNFANRFDSYLTKNLKYKVPENLFKLLKKNFPSNEKYENVIDIGCGTGLSGAAFKDVSNNLVGVDLSHNMINKAKKKNIYDEIFCSDIKIFLQNQKKKYDLFISTDVFIYVGNLNEIFSIISSRSNFKAKFCFSVEKCTNENFKLLKSARYSHSTKYIKFLAAKYNFTILDFLSTTIRFELNKSIDGYLFILEKT